MDESNTGYIETHTSFFFLAFILHFFKTLMVIDGADQGKVPWGTQRFPVTPGRHHVRISARYLFFTNMMANETVIDVYPGTIVRVKYRAPWLVFLKGKITVEALPPTQAGPGAPQFPGAAPAPQLPVAQQPAAQQPFGQQPQTVAPQQPQPQQPQHPPTPKYPGSITTVISTLPPIPVPTPEPTPAASAAAPAASSPVAAAAEASPSAWHPDPTGRHQQRYWDGTRWTEHVSDDGNTSSDPI